MSPTRPLFAAFAAILGAASLLAACGGVTNGALPDGVGDGATKSTNDATATDATPFDATAGDGTIADVTTPDAGPADATTRADATQDAPGTDAEDGGDDDAAGGADGSALDAGSCTVCGGACVDTSSDPENCGGCMQSCDWLGAGALCQASYCVLQLGTIPNLFVSSLAMDANNVYVAAWQGGAPPGGIWSVPVGGGTPTQLSTTENPSEIAIDATYLYWADGMTETLNRIPLGGGPITALASALVPTGPLAVDSANVYWSVSLDGGVSPIMSVPIDGGTPSIITPGEAVSGIAPGPSNLYFGRGFDAEEFEVGVVPLGGGPVTLLGNDLYVADLRFGPTTLFVSAMEPGMGNMVVTVPLDGGPQNTVEPSESPTIGMDDTNFYWTDGLTSGVWMLPKAGGSPAAVVTGQPSFGPYLVAAYGGAVAWTVEYGDQYDPAAYTAIMMTRLK